MNAPIKPPVEFAEATRFLLAFSPDGPWTLTAIRPFRALGARRTATLFCTSIDQAVASLTEHNGKLNIHLTANTTKPVSDKPRERDLDRQIVVQVDIDKDEEGKRLAGASKRKFHRAAAILRVLRGCIDSWRSDIHHRQRQRRPSALAHSRRARGLGHQPKE